MLAACLLALTQKCDAMDNSIYTTLSNQIALNDELSITANNMANANTTGFKKDVQIMSSYTARDKISDLKMPNDIASISDFTSGSLNRKFITKKDSTRHNKVDKRNLATTV